MIKEKKINLETLVCQKKDLFVTEIDGEKVMMHINNSKYYAMNEVGSRIWDLIAEPVPLYEIVNTLLNEYQIDEETCKNAVLEFIINVYNEEIIEVQ